MSLERLEEKLLLRHQGVWYGSIQSLFSGAGSDIKDFRRYVAGDSPRSINWKISAKHDALRVNTRHEDKDVPIHIYLDINPNRSGGVYASNRSMVQQRLADFVLFAHEHHLHHTHVRWSTPDGVSMKKCTTLTQWYSGFTQRETCVMNHKYTSYKSSLASYIQQQGQQKRAACVIIFSDFLAMNEDLQKRMLTLDAKHTLVQITLDVPQLIGRNFSTI